MGMRQHKYMTCEKKRASALRPKVHANLTIAANHNLFHADSRSSNFSRRRKRRMGRRGAYARRDLSDTSYWILTCSALGCLLLILESCPALTEWFGRRECRLRLYFSLLLLVQPAKFQSSDLQSAASEDIHIDLIHGSTHKPMPSVVGDGSAGRWDRESWRRLGEASPQVSIPVFMPLSIEWE